ncbi:hypothetical protein D6D00_09979 [Aureobasidium pullulans]|nr:hypothetical protein D6D00_09979 [Aureobasidium pullulans]
MSWNEEGAINSRTVSTAHFFDAQVSLPSHSLHIRNSSSEPYITPATYITVYVIYIYKQPATAIQANMSWSAAASPQEMIYPVPETRWNEINLKVQMLETLTWRLGMLSGFFGIMCAYLTFLRPHRLEYRSHEIMYVCYSTLVAIFVSRIALLVSLAVEVWFRWDDLNNWKSSVLENKEQETKVTTERSSTKAVSPSPNIRKSSRRKAASPVLDTTQPYDIESEIIDEDELDSDWTVSEASEEDLSTSDLDTED